MKGNEMKLSHWTERLVGQRLTDYEKYLVKVQLVLIIGLILVIYVAIDYVWNK